MKMRWIAIVGSGILVAGCAHPRTSSAIPKDAIQVTKTMKYYDVDGETPQDVARSIMARGPHLERYWAVASTNYGFSHKESYASSAGSCAVQGAVFSAAVTILMPRWKFVSQASVTVEKQWNSYLLATRNHEEQHERIFRASLDSTYLAIKALVAPDCTTLRAEVDRTVAALGRLLREQQNTFDDTEIRDRNSGWPP